VSRGRSTIEQALRGFDGPCLSVGVSSDMLYPSYQQRKIAEAFTASGNDSRYVEIDSPHGHDAFLMELDQLGPMVSEFLDRMD
jgi:homoserine O-acetyltransferase